MPAGDIQCHLGTFLVVIQGVLQASSETGARDAAEHPAMHGQHRAVPTVRLCPPDASHLFWPLSLSPSPLTQSLAPREGQLLAEVTQPLEPQQQRLESLGSGGSGD